MSREIYHWNTWIRYTPFVNIVYGSGRILYYASKAYQDWDKNDYYSHQKEIIKYLFGVSSGVLGFCAGGVAGSLVSGLISNAIADILTTLAAEMITGAFIQNLIITIGDIVTTPLDILTKRTSGEWEELIYSEICIKVPILGCLYSLIRALIYYCKGNSEKAKNSLKNFVIDASGSAVGLLLGYKLHLAACGPEVTGYCHNLCENCNWIDDLCRAIAFFTGKTVEKTEEFLMPYILTLFRAIGKGMGALVKYCLEKLISPPEKEE